MREFALVPGLQSILTAEDLKQIVIATEVPDPDDDKYTTYDQLNLETSDRYGKDLVNYYLQDKGVPEDEEQSYFLFRVTPALDPDTGTHIVRYATDYFHLEGGTEWLTTSEEEITEFVKDACRGCDDTEIALDTILAKYRSADFKVGHVLTFTCRNGTFVYIKTRTDGMSDAYNYRKVDMVGALQTGECLYYKTDGGSFDWIRINSTIVNAANFRDPYATLRDGTTTSSPWYGRPLYFGPDCEGGQTPDEIAKKLWIVSTAYYPANLLESNWELNEVTSDKLYYKKFWVQPIGFDFKTSAILDPRNNDPHERAYLRSPGNFPFEGAHYMAIDSYKDFAKGGIYTCKKKNIYAVTADETFVAGKIYYENSGLAYIPIDLDADEFAETNDEFARTGRQYYVKKGSSVTATSRFLSPRNAPVEADLVGADSDASPYFVSRTGQNIPVGHLKLLKHSHYDSFIGVPSHAVKYYNSSHEDITANRFAIAMEKPPMSHELYELATESVVDIEKIPYYKRAAGTATYNQVLPDQRLYKVQPGVTYYYPGRITVSASDAEPVLSNWSNAGLTAGADFPTEYVKVNISYERYFRNGVQYFKLIRGTYVEQVVAAGQPITGTYYTIKQYYVLSKTSYTYDLYPVITKSAKPISGTLRDGDALPINTFYHCKHFDTMVAPFSMICCYEDNTITEADIAAGRGVESEWKLTQDDEFDPRKKYYEWVPVIIPLDGKSHDLSEVFDIGRQIVGASRPAGFTGTPYENGLLERAPTGTKFKFRKIGVTAGTTIPKTYQCIVDWCKPVVDPNTVYTYTSEIEKFSDLPTKTGLSGLAMYKNFNGQVYCTIEDGSDLSADTLYVRLAAGAIMDKHRYYEVVTQKYVWQQIWIGRGLSSMNCKNIQAYTYNNKLYLSWTDPELIRDDTDPESGVATWTKTSVVIGASFQFTPESPTAVQMVDEGRTIFTSTVKNEFAKKFLVLDFDLYGLTLDDVKGICDNLNTGKHGLAIVATADNGTVCPYGSNNPRLTELDSGHYYDLPTTTTKENDRVITQPLTWATLEEIVRSGNAKAMFQLGDVWELPENSLDGGRRWRAKVVAFDKVTTRRALPNTYIDEGGVENNYVFYIRKPEFQQQAGYGVEAENRFRADMNYYYAQYKQTEDTMIVPGKMYFKKSGENMYRIESPVQADIGTYWEPTSFHVIPDIPLNLLIWNGKIDSNYSGYKSKFNPVEGNLTPTSSYVATPVFCTHVEHEEAWGILTDDDFIEIGRPESIKFSESSPFLYQNLYEFWMGDRNTPVYVRHAVDSTPAYKPFTDFSHNNITFQMLDAINVSPYQGTDSVTGSKTCRWSISNARQILTDMFNGFSDEAFKKAVKKTIVKTWVTYNGNYSLGDNACIEKYFEHGEFFLPSASQLGYNLNWWTQEDNAFDNQRTESKEVSNEWYNTGAIMPDTVTPRKWLLRTSSALNAVMAIDETGTFVSGNAGTTTGLYSFPCFTVG